MGERDSDWSELLHVTGVSHLLSFLISHCYGVFNHSANARTITTTGLCAMTKTPHRYVVSYLISYSLAPRRPSPEYEWARECDRTRDDWAVGCHVDPSRIAPNSTRRLAHRLLQLAPRTTQACGRATLLLFPPHSGRFLCDDEQARRVRHFLHDGLVTPSMRCFVHQHSPYDRSAGLISYHSNDKLIRVPRLL